MSASVTRFENERLTIVFLKGESHATIKWTGVSDSKNPMSFLAPVIDKVVQNSRGMKVTVDFSQMEFMSSSAVSPIIDLVKMLHETCPDVLVVFADNDWQRVHARCLRTITRVLKRVRVEMRPASSEGG